MIERDNRFHHALEASRDGLWDWHLPSGEIYFSPGYLRMLGYQDDELPGTLDTWRDLFALPEDAPRVLEQYRAALDSGRLKSKAYRKYGPNGTGAKNKRRALRCSTTVTMASLPCFHFLTASSLWQNTDHVEKHGTRQDQYEYGVKKNDNHNT